MSDRGPARRCGCGEAVAAGSATTNKNGGLMLSHYRCGKCGATFTIASGDHVASAAITMLVLAALIAVPFVPKLLPGLPVALSYGIAGVGAAGALFQLVRALLYGLAWRAHPKAQLNL